MFSFFFSLSLSSLIIVVTEISPLAITLHYAPAPPRNTFVRTIQLTEAKSFYGKGSDLRFTWRIRTGALVEEVFECEKATKIVKRLSKWAQRRADEEAKQKKKEEELMQAVCFDVFLLLFFLSSLLIFSLGKLTSKGG